MMLVFSCIHCRVVLKIFVRTFKHFQEDSRLKLASRYLALSALGCVSHYLWFDLPNYSYGIYYLQWLAFRNDGVYSAADYAKIMSERMLKFRDQGPQKFWNPFERDQTIKRRRYFVVKLLQGAIRGLAYLHNHDRLHQSLGPSSIVIKYAFAPAELV